MQEKITIHQLVGKLVVELKRAGFTDSTIWQCYMPRVGSIEHYYEKLGQVYYDPMVTDAPVLCSRRYCASVIISTPAAQAWLSALPAGGFFLRACKAASS